jgi:hypothetical protein
MLMPVEFVQNRTVILYFAFLLPVHHSPLNTSDLFGTDLYNNAVPLVLYTLFGKYVLEISEANMHFPQIPLGRISMQQIRLAHTASDHSPQSTAIMRPETTFIQLHLLLHCSQCEFFSSAVQLHQKQCSS